MRKTYFQASLWCHLTRHFSVSDVSTCWAWLVSIVCLSSGPPRWYHTAVAVFAVPFWKMFVFGGNSGDLNDANSPQVHSLTSQSCYLCRAYVDSHPCVGCPQGSYLSDLCVYETGQQMWSQPNVAGKVPQARSDTQMVRPFSFLTLLTFL
jgi:dynein heavy chain